MDNSNLDTAASPAIAAKGLSKWFGDDAARIKAVDDVTLSVGSAKWSTSWGLQAAARPRC